MTAERAKVGDGNAKSFQMRARTDLMVIAGFVVLAFIVIMVDPDRAFEWIASHKEVQVDELLTAVVTVGAGFAIFSWRRWTDLSRQVAEYKRLQVELSSMNHTAALLGETDDLLQSCLSIDEAYKVIIRHFELQFPEMNGAVFAFEQAHDTAEVATTWGRPSVGHKTFAMKDCWALRRGRINISHARDPKLACAHIGPVLPEYAICVPMMAQGESIGVLYLDTGTEAGKGRALTEPEERTVKTLAEHLALAVANLNLREDLRTQSIRDPLTGLFNRRYMEESLEREFHRAIRKDTPLAVLMVDLDHFKRFNDTYGHEAGDAVLRELARIFQTHLRVEDIASRYGGEEFMLILPEMNEATARDCAARLHAATRTIQLQHYGQKLDGITFSGGIACYPRHGATADALLHAADAALYRAKEQGRDRVVTAE